MAGELLADQRLKLGHSPIVDGAGVARRIEAFGRLGLRPGRRLLDVGCGSGPYSLALSSWFGAVDGIDIEPERLATFRQRLRSLPPARRAAITVHEMSGVALDFADATFDTIVAIETLEHFDQLHCVLAELRRVATPDATLLITSPNRWFPFETHGAQWRGRIIRWPFTLGLPYLKPLHDRLSQARTFTATSLLVWLAGAGWRVTGYSYVMPPFDNWDAGRRFLAPLTRRLEKSAFTRVGVSVVLAAEPDPSGPSTLNWWDAHRRIQTLPRR